MTPIPVESTATTSPERVPPEALLEKDLRDYLADHLGEAFGEPLELLGTEVPCDVGRIDVLARDAAGTILVIELKNRTCTRDVVGQLLSYLGSVRKQYASSVVRGVAVGPAFDASALSALEATSDIVFFTFRVAYSITESGKSPNLRGISSANRDRVSLGKLWVIDVNKEIIFRKGNMQDAVSLRSVQLKPGQGAAFNSIYVPFSEIELVGDGYAVGRFRMTIVEDRPS